MTNPTPTAAAHARVSRIGIRKGDADYPYAFDMAQKGFYAWVIARNLGASKELITALGGPQIVQY